ncbi:MAG TPA: ABC transporter permease, partial [Phototrophicaceae bacterium]|nr:ABC transporter permease [Phototrophicaceae bacterium]
MSKIITIISKELRRTFGDRTLLILMFVLPLTVATIIAVTFGGITRSDAPITDIPVAIVNQDQGGANGNNGTVLVNILMPPVSTDTVNTADTAGTTAGATTTGTSGCPGSQIGSSDAATSMQTLIHAEKLDDPALARAGVNEGKYAAAVIIPANFTADLTYSATHTEIT